MTARRAYPSDISDARWAPVEPTLTAWQQARIDRRPTGEPARTDVREVFNAILYVNRTGIAWKYLPHDFPPHSTVYYYAAWRDEGILAQPNDDLTGLARVKAGRDPQPTAAVIDTQSVKTSTARGDLGHRRREEDRRTQTRHRHGRARPAPGWP